MRSSKIAALLMAFMPIGAARAQVVINEIFYNAPNDLKDVQWTEIHNTTNQRVDLTDWTFDEGKVYVFPKGTAIEARGYLVVALNPDRFAKVYGTAAIGPLKRPLSRSGERIELRDSQKKSVDVIRYKDKAPWPISADGYSPSLERICPSCSGELSENWAASSFAPTPKPAGTPAKKNASYSAALPPVVTVTGESIDLSPGQSLHVEARVNDAGTVSAVTLMYRVLAGGVASQETTVAMVKKPAGVFVADIPPQKAGTLVRYRVKAVGESGAVRFCPAENDLRPTFSAYVHEKWKSARIPFALIIRGAPDNPAAQEPQSSSQIPTDASRGGIDRDRRGSRPFFFGFGGPREMPDSRPSRGSSAFLYVDPATGKLSLFDHIKVLPRNNGGGFKVSFHKDHTLNGMSAVNLVFEGSERFLMAEALAYDVYQRAGSPAPATEFVRLWVDGSLLGYHLMVERPNKTFLRRNRVDDNGNLYKLIWYGSDVVDKHQKKTNVQTGHDDLLALISLLEKNNKDADALWKVIQDNFDVDQVATYFSVNMVLSHWDGYFNNYFAYHDTKNGKWMMVPWDQDKTWGYYDGLPDGQVFYDMPLTFGMAGARPPGARETEGGQTRRGGFGGLFGGGFGGGFTPWWRESGYFSGPLLANPQFRKLFLARTAEILDKVYTEETYVALIDEMADRLAEDVRLRAQADGQAIKSGTQQLKRNAEMLKSHLLKRRQFLLEKLKQQ